MGLVVICNQNVMYIVSSYIIITFMVLFIYFCIQKFEGLILCDLVQCTYIHICFRIILSLIIERVLQPISRLQSGRENNPSRYSWRVLITGEICDSSIYIVNLYSMTSLKYWNKVLTWEHYNANMFSFW